jgi:hypothetical protein
MQMMEDEEEIPLQKMKIEVQKDLVSGANVPMPKTFLKPIDFSLPLVLRTHPTLRGYCA